jgi:hypothetical protein
MKKTALIMIASASMLLAAPGAGNMKASEGMFIMSKGQGSGMGMMKMKGKCCKKSQKCHSMKNKNMQNKMMKGKMKMNSPFLIKHGLPHLTKMIMPYLNDPAFNLTSEQKFQLAKVRSSTMSAIMEAKPVVMALRKEIVNASAGGASLDVLKGKVAELALLEAAATMTQLKCIEATKDILTKDQLFFLLANKNKNKDHGKKQMKKRSSMKCASGKCGQGMRKQ